MLVVPNTSWGEGSYLTAMQDRGITLEAIDVSRMLVIFSNGVVLPIILMTDKDGFPVERWEDCIRYDFGCDGIGYGSAASSDITADLN